MMSQSKDLLSQQTENIVGLSSPTALAYELGLPRFFGFADIAKQGLIYGWADPEDGHNWTDGLDAELLVTFPPPPPNARLKISVSGEAYLAPNQREQDVTLYVNGYRAGFWRLKSRKECVLETTLEPDWCVAKKELVRMKMLWHIPGSISPAESGDGLDKRVLGFCFRQIIIEID